jgi:hypothetical protein
MADQFIVGLQGRLMAGSPGDHLMERGVINGIDVKKDANVQTAAAYDRRHPHVLVIVRPVFFLELAR